MEIRAVVFDLFGTLIDDSPPADYGEFLTETARVLGADPERFSEVWKAYDLERYTTPIEDCFAEANACALHCGSVPSWFLE